MKVVSDPLNPSAPARKEPMMFMGKVVRAAPGSTEKEGDTVMLDAANREFYTADGKVESFEPIFSPVGKGCRICGDSQAETRFGVCFKCCNPLKEHP